MTSSSGSRDSADADVADVARLRRELDAARDDLAVARDELVVANDELARSRAALEALAGEVAHDLRNPLTAVSMSLQMLREQRSVQDDDEALWMVERALAGTSRINELIEQRLITPGTTC
ncbi:MAG TPA: histidine kinase dimerization/phospho-acceptor domain-containing protein [Nocardioidaceae bacterium]|nr:histidine kinase dimerization/phospho-acceptor domain-containing protein [Nocardioidaceae bacterium]